MAQFVEYTGKDILNLTDEEFALVLLGDPAKGVPPLTPPEPKPEPHYQDMGEQGEEEYQEDKDMTAEEFEEFLDREFPDYPRYTPEAFRKIGVENYWW